MTSGAYKIVSERLSTMTSAAPVPTIPNSVPTRYELVQLKTMIRRATRLLAYRWTVTNTSKLTILFVQKTRAPTFEMPAVPQLVGTIEVKARVDDPLCATRDRS